MIFYIDYTRWLHPQGYLLLMLNPFSIPYTIVRFPLTVRFTVPEVDIVKGLTHDAFSPDAIVTLVFQTVSCVRKISPLPFVASPLVAPFSPWKKPNTTSTSGFASVMQCLQYLLVAIEPSLIERDVICLIAMFKSFL